MKLKNKLVGNFRVSEFLMYAPSPCAATFAKIFNWIDILNDARNELSKQRGEDSPITINAGARSLRHELSKGRTGQSQHVYQNYKGAVDVTCEGDIKELYEILLRDKRISRACLYVKANFIHIDMLPSNHRKYLFDESLKKWVRIFS